MYCFILFKEKSNFILDFKCLIKNNIYIYIKPQKKIIMFEYPNELQIIFDKLNKNGIKPIIVGGYIRDKLLKIESTDIDIELYGIESFSKLEKILENFGSVNTVGKNFGVCKLTLKRLEIDFTFPRIDNKVSSGHKGFKIDVQSDLSFEEAAKRRDFTINAIGYDVVENKILDPYNGQKDLKNKIIKAVSFKTFFEDPLRILRASAFCSRFGFKMQSELFNRCKTMCEKGFLNELPKERIYGEIKKILLKSQKPSIGFNILNEMGALRYLKPMDKLDKTSLDSVLNVLDNITKLKTDSKETNLALMLSALCCKFDDKQTKIFISNLTTQKILQRKVLTLLFDDFKINYSDSELYRLATKVNIEHFLILHEAINYSLDKKIFYDLKQRAKKLNILNKKAKPLLRGKDILECGIKPSKDYSKVLDLAYEAQMDKKITNSKEAKEWLKDYLSAK